MRQITITQEVYENKQVIEVAQDVIENAGDNLNNPSITDDSLTPSTLDICTQFAWNCIFHSFDATNDFSLPAHQHSYDNVAERLTDGSYCRRTCDQAL
jgi:hypothetical protein